MPQSVSGGKPAGGKQSDAAQRAAGGSAGDLPEKAAAAKPDTNTTSGTDGGGESIDVAESAKPDGAANKKTNGGRGRRPGRNRRARSSGKTAGEEDSAQRSTPGSPDTTTAGPADEPEADTADASDTHRDDPRTDSDCASPQGSPPGTSQRPDRIAAAFAALEERQGTLRDDRERWFRVAIVMSLVATVCAGFGIWAAVRSEYVPYIVAVDDLGRVQPVQAPKVIENWPDVAVRRELADLVSDWRSITSDPVVLRQRYRRLQYFLEENSAADRKVRQWAIETRPLTRAETDTVDVAVTSVNFVGGSTWLVEWTENRRPRATGQIDETTRWRGSFVLRKRRITDPAWLTNNPFGMIIEDIDARRLDT